MTRHVATHPAVRLQSQRRSAPTPAARRATAPGASTFTAHSRVVDRGGCHRSAMTSVNVLPLPVSLLKVIRPSSRIASFWQSKYAGRDRRPPGGAWTIQAHTKYLPVIVDLKQNSLDALLAKVAFFSVCVSGDSSLCRRCQAALEISPRPLRTAHASRRRVERAPWTSARTARHRSVGGARPRTR